MSIEQHLDAIQLGSLEDTNRCGEILANVLPSHVCLGLVGTLGAGKTALAQAFIAAHGVDRHQITSPTFALVQSYPAAARTIHHLDAYRIRDEDEFFEIGADELFEDSEATVLVEWADKFRDYLPAETLWMELDWHSDQTRRVHFSGDPGRWRSIVEDVTRRYRGGLDGGADGHESAGRSD